MSKTTGHGIAIIGLEGSGKTVFLAALAQAMQDNDGYPHLEASGNGAVKTRMYAAEIWDAIQLGKWPKSTNMGTLGTLSWTWHSTDDVSYTVRLPDCAGQDIRQIFESGGENKYQIKLEADIFASEHVLLLFNLKELIDLYGRPGLSRKRVSIETAVCAAITRLSKKRKPFSVLLTQYDSYQTLIEEKFEADLLSAIKYYSMSLWRVIDRHKPNLLPVSAVETENRFKDGIAGRFPTINAKPTAAVLEVANMINACLLAERQQSILREEERILREKKRKQEQAWKQISSSRKKIAMRLSVGVAIVASVLFGVACMTLSFPVAALLVGIVLASSKMGIKAACHFELPFLVLTAAILAAVIAGVASLAALAMLSPYPYTGCCLIVAVVSAVHVVMVGVWEWAHCEEHREGWFWGQHERGKHGGLLSAVKAYSVTLTLWRELSRCGARLRRFRR